MNHHPRERGYTLVEAILVVAIFSMAMGMIFGTIVFLYRVNANAIEQAYQLQNSRRAVEQLTNQLRVAEPGAEGSYPLQTIGPYAITFFSNIDGTGVQRVRYFLQNGNLVRGTVIATGTPLIYATSTEATTTVAQYIRNDTTSTPMFRYYNSSGVEITTFTSVVDVRFVLISVVANINPATAPEEFVLRSSATLRNLKDNL